MYIVIMIGCNFFPLVDFHPTNKHFSNTEFSHSVAAYTNYSAKLPFTQCGQHLFPFLCFESKDTPKSLSSDTFFLFGKRRTAESVLDFHNNPRCSRVLCLGLINHHFELQCNYINHETPVSEYFLFFSQACPAQSCLLYSKLFSFESQSSMPHTCDYRVCLLAFKAVVKRAGVTLKRA